MIHLKLQHLLLICRCRCSTFNNDVTAFSDVILKDNIDTIDNALDRVKGMRGVFFDRKDNKQQRQTGVIAQEVEPFLPEW